MTEGVPFTESRKIRAASLIRSGGARDDRQNLSTRMLRNRSVVGDLGPRMTHYRLRAADGTSPGGDQRVSALSHSPHLKVRRCGGWEVLRGLITGVGVEDQDTAAILRRGFVTDLCRNRVHVS